MTRTTRHGYLVFWVTTLAAGSSLASAQVPKFGVVLGNIDHRHPSVDSAVGRIMPLGCTGWITYFGAILTAGHCQDPQALTIQFQVPLSAANGATNNPTDPNDIYGITFVSAVNAGGVDWGVVRASPTGDLTPAWRQQAFVRFAPMDQVVTNLAQLMVQVTGFGVDGPPPQWGNGGAQNQYNQTEQTDNGKYVTGATTYLYPYQICYLLDTQPGNSGSPAYVNATRIAVGIHVASTGNTKPLCGYANMATAIDEPSLVAAMQEFPGSAFSPVILPGNTLFVDGGSLMVTSTGSVMSPYHRISEAFDKAASLNGRVLISLTAGTYADLPYSLQLGSAGDVTVTMPVGDVNFFPGLVKAP